MTLLSLVIKKKLKIQHFIKQKFFFRPENVSSTLIDVIKNAKNGDVWVVEDNNKPYQYIHPSKDSFVDSHL